MFVPSVARVQSISKPTETRLSNSNIGDDIRTIEINADVLLNACKDIGLAVNTGKTCTWK